MAGDLHRRKGSESTTTSEATEANGPQPEIEKAKPKLDKSGLYDLQQVKRLLDDEVIAVS